MRDRYRHSAVSRVRDLVGQDSCVAIFGSQGVQLSPGNRFVACLHFMHGVSFEVDGISARMEASFGASEVTFLLEK